MSFLIPSPINQIDFSSSHGGDHTLSIKRDDLIHPLISGNKWRKLSLHIQQFPTTPQNGIVTFGGPWSNHLLATASACQIYEISSIGYVRGEYYKYVNPILLECLNLGMELRYLSNEDFDQAKSHMDDFATTENLADWSWLPMGGDDALGKQGIQQVVQEVLSTGLYPDVWLVASGTGATAAGILTALDYPCELLVYPAINQLEEIAKLNRKLMAIQSKATWKIANPHRCRFGAVDEVLIDFIRSFHSQTGVLLDPLYNGKMMESYFRTNQQTDKQVIAYHSGGLVGWKGIAPKWSKRTDLSFLSDM